MISVGKLLPLLLIPILLSALAAACSSSDEGDAGTSGESVAAASTDGGTGTEGEPVVYKLKQELDMNVELTSTKFSRIRRIPIEYTCAKNTRYDNDGTFRYGQEWSPPLAWDNVPEGTVSIAVIMDDPDAKLERFVDLTEPWVHWVIWGIPGDATELAEQVATTTEVLSIGPNARQGTNDNGNVGYDGPCPPPNITTIFKRRDGSPDATTDPNQPHGYMFRVYALDAEIDLPAGSTKYELLEAMDGHILGAGEARAEFVNKHIIK